MSKKFCTSIFVLVRPRRGLKTQKQSRDSTIDEMLRFAVSSTHRVRAERPEKPLVQAVYYVQCSGKPFSVNCTDGIGLSVPVPTESTNNVQKTHSFPHGVRSKDTAKLLDHTELSLTLSNKLLDNYYWSLILDVAVDCLPGG